MKTIFGKTTRAAAGLTVSTLLLTGTGCDTAAATKRAEGAYEAGLHKPYSSLTVSPSKETAPPSLYEQAPPLSVVPTSEEIQNEENRVYAWALQTAKHPPENFVCHEGGWGTYAYHVPLDGDEPSHCDVLEWYTGCWHLRENEEEPPKNSMYIIGTADVLDLLRKKYVFSSLSENKLDKNNDKDGAQRPLHSIWLHQSRNNPYSFKADFDLLKKTQLPVWSVEIKSGELQITYEQIRYIETWVKERQCFTITPLPSQDIRWERSVSLKRRGGVVPVYGPETVPADRVRPYADIASELSAAFPPP